MKITDRAPADLITLGYCIGVVSTVLLAVFLTLLLELVA